MVLTLTSKPNSYLVQEKVVEFVQGVATKSFSAVLTGFG